MLRAFLSIVEVMIAPFSDDKLNLSYSVVLQTNSTIDDINIQQMIANIAHFINEKETGEFKILKENIIITNSSGEVLY